MSTPWIRIFALSSLAAFCFLCPNPNVRPAEAGPPPGYTLVWSDEFPGTTLDTSKWGYLLLASQIGKFDEGCNVMDAVSLDGQGNLVITTWTDQNRQCSGHPPGSPANSPHQTGMIATGDDRQANGQPWLHLNPPGDKRVAKYGYVEARIMFTGQQPGLTDAQRVWSSYWFQSPTYGNPIDVPRSAGTEIDVVEHRSNSPDAPSALHWDSYCPISAAKSAGGDNHSGNGNLSSGYHTYGLEWTPDVLRFYYDCVLVWTVNNSPQIDPPSQLSCTWPQNPPPPPQSPFVLGPVSRAGEYIILDNEVRLPVDPVTHLPLAVDYGAKGDPRNAIMTVDYVRWYEDRFPPPPVANLAAVSPHGMTTMAVSWTAPGDDGTGQTATKYDLRYSTSPITAANFSSATYVTSTAPPSAAGFPECQVITGLTECTTYYFAIKTMDEAGNWSAISNVPSAITECDINRTATCPTLNPDTVAPGKVSDLSVLATGQTTGAVVVSWTAPGDDGTSGKASEYDLRYSLSSIDDSNFGSAARVTIAAPQVAGSPECRVVRFPCACTPHYFAIRTKDESGNWSVVSNSPSGPTTCTNQLAECSGAAMLAVPNDDAPRLLSAPRPNPARGTTSFQILVPRESRGAMLRVGVFDVHGRQVRSLVDRIASPGPANIEWNLLDDSGHHVASGLYMVRVDVGDTRKTFRLVVVR